MCSCRRIAVPWWLVPIDGCRGQCDRTAVVDRKLRSMNSMAYDFWHHLSPPLSTINQAVPQESSRVLREENSNVVSLGCLVERVSTVANLALPLLLRLEFS